MGSTYEVMLATFGKNSDSRELMQQEAIQARGGHCIGCSFCESLTAKGPAIISASLRSDNFSVRVTCTIDAGRTYPFRKEGSKREDCPSCRRHERRQAVAIAIPEV